MNINQVLSEWASEFEVSKDQLDSMNSTFNVILQNVINTTPIEEYEKALLKVKQSYQMIAKHM